MSAANLKDRISNLLEVEKVAYQMEIARRINVLKDRTIKFVINEMKDDNEIEVSSIRRVGRFKLKFYWKPGTDRYTINRVIDLKLILLNLHLEYSNVQQNFGPKIAIESLKELTSRGILPLISSSIVGPVRKWYGPNKNWLGNEITVPSGDIDVISVENGGRILWIGEVKMRGDYIKIHQVRHFLNNIKNFRDKMFRDKGIFFEIKPFIVAPLLSQSAKHYCNVNHVNVIECKKIYYPKKTTQRDLEFFYKRYKRVMGLPNLEIIDSNALPIDYITMEFQRRPFQNTI